MHPLKPATPQRCAASVSRADSTATVTQPMAASRPVPPAMGERTPARQQDAVAELEESAVRARPVAAERASTCRHRTRTAESAAIPAVPMRPARAVPAGATPDSSTATAASMPCQVPTTAARSTRARRCVVAMSVLGLSAQHLQSAVPTTPVGWRTVRADSSIVAGMRSARVRSRSWARYAPIAPTAALLDVAHAEQAECATPGTSVAAERASRRTTRIAAPAGRPATRRWRWKRAARVRPIRRSSNAIAAAPVMRALPTKRAPRECA